MTTQHTPDDGHSSIEHLLVQDHPRAVRFAVGLLFIALSLFIAMAIPPVRDAIEQFDKAIYDVTYPIKWGPLTVLAHALDFLGSSLFVWPLRLVMTIYLSWRRRWVALATWLLAIALSEPFIGSLKALYDRARPPVALVDVESGSFPSGHSVAGAVVALSLAVCLVSAGPRRRNLELAAAAFALVMGGSRIYLGAHWLTDVVAGVAFGAAVVLASAAVVQWWRERRLALIADQMSA
ncbi:MAG TPA: phosphatase PAP2 family protein [Acidimicrobiia bacterium]|nr:phosphatase PAP2 family protein [Acidimicrobiia bacterium]